MALVQIGWDVRNNKPLMGEQVGNTLVSPSGTFTMDPGASSRPNPWTNPSGAFVTPESPIPWTNTREAPVPPGSPTPWTDFLAPPSSRGGTTASNTRASSIGGSILEPGYQTPYNDPLKALMNTLRGQGRYVSMGNPAIMQGLRRVASGLVPQYLNSIMTQQSFPNDTSIDTGFGNFLQTMTQGQSTAPNWGYNQAAQFMGNMNSLLRQIDAITSGLGLTSKDPEFLARLAEAMQKAGIPGVLQQVIGGDLWGDLDAQQGMYLASYAPFLGAGLLPGLSKVATGQRGLWDQVLAEAIGAQGQPFSFLDLLTGSLGIPYTGPKY